METRTSSGAGIDIDTARWRLAYDTVSALVATHQSHYRQQLPISASSHDSSAASCSAVSHSHRDNADMIHTLQQWQQQPQQRGPQLTQSSPMPFQPPVLLNSVSLQHFTRMTSVQSVLPSPVQWQSSELSQSATAMSLSSVDVCGIQPTAARTRADGDDGVVRLVGDGQALVSLFRRLLDTFYAETFLWMYTNVLLHPAARHTRNRLHWLGAMTSRSLQQAASNVLTGFIAGCRQSRHALQTDVEQTLMATTLLGRAVRLAGLAVELGVVLNPILMMRSFSSVVKDLVYRTSSHLAAQQPANSTRPTPPAPATRLYRYGSDSSFGHHHHHEPGTWYSGPQHVASFFSTTTTPTTTTTRRRHDHTFRRVRFPPPPPPYPGFLIHFLLRITAIRQGSLFVCLPIHSPSASTSFTFIQPACPTAVPANITVLPLWRVAESVLLESSSAQSITDDFHITDNTSYEDLLRLDETIGEVKHRGLQLTDVQHLPSYEVQESASSTAHDTSVQVCVICLDDFIARQMIRALPCCHEFHAKCIDRWLIINRTCPVCRYDVNPQSIQSMTSV